MFEYTFFKPGIKYKNGRPYIYPDFRAISKRQDLMIKGRDFYAVYDSNTGFWSTNMMDVVNIVDPILYSYQQNGHQDMQIETLEHYSNAQWKSFLTYCKSLSDNFVSLDRHVLFANSKVKRTDFATKTLPYELVTGDCPAYKELVKTLYDKEESDKFEWAIGSIFAGDSKNIQKFIVFRGAPGTGKSTIINIIQMLFEGYYGLFDAAALTSGSSAFPLESLKDNPLVGIQHDGDLSKISDNTILNSVVSHEYQNMNVKYAHPYPIKMDTFLFMGTNKPVRITDSKSGIVRRLIDVYPSERKVPTERYFELMKQIEFELGAIANYCIRKYKRMGPNYYDKYVPTRMMTVTNDIYAFMEEKYWDYLNVDYITGRSAWLAFKEWAEDCNIKKIPTNAEFKEELKSYFKVYLPSKVIDGKRVKDYYSEFKSEKFLYLEESEKVSEQEKDIPKWLKLSKQPSILDPLYADCTAQYSNVDGVPLYSWDKVRTTLKDLDTSKEHYILPPVQHIIVDFDLKDAEGNKSLELNLEAAKNFPETYVETSKSGQGLHLHYIYTGDVDKLKNIFDDYIEIKVFKGKSALRRKLYLCNDHEITTISSGLPLKEEKMISAQVLSDEKHLRACIKKALRKEIHPNTTPNMNYIKKVLDDAYYSGMHYDVSDMRQAVLTFAMDSTNQKENCLKLMQEMKWKSDDIGQHVDSVEKDIVVYDIECYPNLFLVCYKNINTGAKTALFNPKPHQIEDMLKYRLVGFNNRGYDNHMLYACMLGYSNEQLYRLSQRIISGEPRSAFSEAYNLSYTDAYDYPTKKQSLKKWEIELGMHHQEMDIPWDKPCSEELWDRVAEYCMNDVEATQAVWETTQSDFNARIILVELANIFCTRVQSCPNDTTNTLTGRIIFGNERNPQKEFVYTDLSKEFPGYEFKNGKSTYLGIEVGEGGYAEGHPGMYSNVKVLDIAGMHPSSAFALNIFGDKYTNRYHLLYDLRIALKHKDFDSVEPLLKKYIPEEEELIHKLIFLVSKFKDDKHGLKALCNALKLAINSVYGLTSAKFDNLFRDPRNVDNIVAKRGALFMISLKHELEKRGIQVIHIKTDSIKLSNMTPEIEKFIIDYGKRYGYNFETEHVFERFAIVNDAVYIAKCSDEDPEEELRGKWTATGTQFAVPYVFKTLFSKEALKFEDFCFTKSVSSPATMYLDINEDLPNVELAEKEKEIRQYNSTHEKPRRSIPEYSDFSNEKLDNYISTGHSYKFVGKVGGFVPIKPGCGGGYLMRYDKGKYSAVAGTKGYRWLEAEDVKGTDLEQCIDKSYPQKLAQDAIDALNKIGDFNSFVGNAPF